MVFGYASSIAKNHNDSANSLGLPHNFAVQSLHSVCLYSGMANLLPIQNVMQHYI